MAASRKKRVRFTIDINFAREADKVAFSERLKAVRDLGSSGINDPSLIMHARGRTDVGRGRTVHVRSLVPRPRPHKEGKGSGCAESAVLLSIGLQFSDIPRDIYCNATCIRTRSNDCR